MTKKDYELIAQSIWRSGCIEDKNKVRQLAREKMRRLIAYDLSSWLGEDNPRFDKIKFFQACGIDDSELKGQDEPLLCVHKGCEALQTADGEYCEKHYPSIKK